MAATVQYRFCEFKFHEIYRVEGEDILLKCVEDEGAVVGG
jgi:hypothetical protein